MSIQPDGENIRRAVKWIGTQRKDDPGIPLAKLIDQASLSFNLTPAEADGLTHMLSIATDEEE
jgi:hypothetical protein